MVLWLKVKLWFNFRLNVSFGQTSDNIEKYLTNVLTKSKQFVVNSEINIKFI